MRNRPSTPAAARPTPTQAPRCRLLLASGSPRRRELVRWLGLPVRVQVPRVDETPRPGETPEAYVLRLARAKAAALRTAAGADDIILAADTAVVFAQRILGKPRDEAEAAAMLQQLQGRAHGVLTGFALLWPAQGREHSQVVRAAVHMRPLSAEEIAAYIATGDPLDKAGAYAAQNPVFRPVQAVEGCFANVVGLPVCAVAQALAAWGCPPVRGMVPRCRAAFGYNCAIGIP